MLSDWELEEKGILLAQQEAQKGRKPSDIIAILADYFPPRYSGDTRFMSVLLCFKRAFQIPLGEASYVGAWRGFYNNATDEDINRAFQPWLDKFRNQ